VLKIFHVPRTRSVRPIWLCYELDIPVDVEPIDFSPEYRDTPEWRGISPAGKVPALIDGDLQMLESGAMVDYLLERYGEGRLRPTPGTPQSALHHQWCWFAEATLIRPLGLYRVLRSKPEDAAQLIAEARSKFHEALNVVEQALTDRHYLLGAEFGAADIMMGYSVALIERLLDERHANTAEYLARLKSRDAYQRVLALPGARD
jgi:glutathione S-transferase